MGYGAILAKLESLPEGERALAHGIYVDDDGRCGCAIGKLLSPEIRRRLISKNPEDSSYSNYNGSSISTVRKLLGISLMKEYGVSYDALFYLQKANDDFSGDKVARYKYILGWLQEQLSSD